MVRIVSGQFGGLRLDTPATDLRPTEEKVRAAFFNIIFSLTDFEDKIFLDFCAGSGAMGIEALSRGFNKAIFIEKNKKAAAVIKKNINKLKVNNLGEVYTIDGFNISRNYIEKISMADVIYIDPPYKMINKINIILPELMNLWDRRNVIIAVETGELFDFSDDLWSKKEKRYGNTFLTIFRRKENDK